MVITNEQITELSKKVRDKMIIVNDKYTVTRKHIKYLTAIMFTGRKVEDTPAEFVDSPDPEDSTRTIRVLRAPATMKTVFDVPAKSLDEPLEDLDEDIRKKRFEEIFALYE